MTEKINFDLNNYFKWLNYKKLSLNTKKTFYQILKPKGKLINENIVKIKIGEQELEKVNVIKYLGIKIDENLSFKQNGEYVCSKIAKKLSFFARVSKKMPLYCRINVYNTIIGPYYNYCASVFFLNNQEILNDLQILQNRGMRIILRCDRYTNIQIMLKILNWMDVKTRIHFCILLFIFKIKNKLLPEYLLNNIKFVKDRTIRTLRNANDFSITRKSKSATHNSLFHNGLLMYNKLPNDLKVETNINIFRNKLVKHLM